MVSSSASVNSTKSRIMDTAELLFATNGFSGTSIREICSAAGANHAAVHYHFKSKDDLALAIFERRMAGVAARRRQMLDDLVSADEIPSVRSIVETIVLPLAELIASEGDSGRAYVGMVASVMHERPGLIWAAFRKHNRENLGLQTDCLTKALPDIPTEVIGHRMTLVNSASSHFLAHPLRLAMHGSDISVEQPGANMVSEVVDFLAGGVAAPSTTPAAVQDSGDKR